MKLRDLNPDFYYDRYTFEIRAERIEMQFDFRIGEAIRFSPKMTLLPGRHKACVPSPEEIEGLVFHIGLIELISYWKCACPPAVHLPRRLSEPQQQWWKKLYWKGLGEFFYQNGIHSTPADFLNFQFDETAPAVSDFTYCRIEGSEAVIVPIGGGKDSVVTLEHHRRTHRIVPFIINPRGATLACARIAGFPTENDIVILQRQIDPELLRLNGEGYLNGHTPFSAMLAFYSLLVAYCTGVRDVALSNESSANEPTIPGTDINHQYSKSLEFEEDFRSYVAQYMNDVAHYYSYLRPLTELQIAERFARYPAYFKVFKSCNAGSKQNIWCCKCSKCLFAFIILSPFIDKATMVEIFGEDLLDNWEMKTYFDELTGIAEVKPFECVGTVDEVNQALRMVLHQRQDACLLRYYYKLKIEN